MKTVKGRQLGMSSPIQREICHGTTGDVACDTYHDFQTDIDIMSSLQMDAYRFSISWSRVLPEAKEKVNPKGLDYYDRLIDARV